MTDVSFYHLQRSDLEQALPMLLEKTLSAGKRALVLVGSEERMEALDNLLWTYDPASWLPHASQGESEPENHPIWLSTEDENANAADFLFLADGATSSHIGDFERAFDLFDGHDDTAVEKARDRWKAYKADGHSVTYWRQSDGGKWEKAEA